MNDIEKHTRLIRSLVIGLALVASAVSLKNVAINVDAADIQCAIHIMKMGLVQASTEYVDFDKATKRCVNRLAGPPEGFIPYKPNNRNP